MSFEAVELSRGRRVAVRDVISGDVMDDVIAKDVVLLRLRGDGASVRQHDTSAVVVAAVRRFSRRRAAVTGGGWRSRSLGQTQLLEDAALDRLDAGALQQEPFQQADVVERTSTSITFRPRQRRRRRQNDDGQAQNHRPPTHCPASLRPLFEISPDLNRPLLF